MIEKLIISHSDASVSSIEFNTDIKINISYLQDIKRKILAFEDIITNNQSLNYGVHSHRDFEIFQSVLSYYTSHPELVNY